MSDIPLTVSMLALVAVLGLWIGSWRIYGVGFGIGGVLFGGIVVGHLAQTSGIVLNGDMLNFIQEFGLILFVYTIGIQVGPGFFSSLRASGLQLNGFALLLVLLGALVTAAIHYLFKVPLPAILGVFSGAVTNTPALGAGQQILMDIGTDNAVINKMGMAYAMAYPFGICGILLVMWLIRLFFKVNIEREAKAFDRDNMLNREVLHTINIEVCNPNLNGLTLHEIPLLSRDDLVCSRLKRGNTLMVPLPSTRVELGDYLHLVGQKAILEQARLVIGEEVDVSLSTKGTELTMARVVITNEKVLGKKIRDLNLKEKY
ncbi:MAG: putative transporter, partial [Enterobacteriaceae bacterium]